MVKYHYMVDGVSHEGTRISYGYAPSKDYEEHKRIMDKLDGLKEVRVYYKPGNPDQSLLAPGASGGNVVMGLAGIWVIAIALVLFYLMFLGNDNFLESIHAMKNTIIENSGGGRP
jgi:hypothetical protein